MRGAVLSGATCTDKACSSLGLYRQEVIGRWEDKIKKRLIRTSGNSVCPSERHFIYLNMSMVLMKKRKGHVK